MAAPTITLLNHTSLTTADTNTGWNDLTTADADIKVEGTNAMSGIFRADGEQGYYDAGSAPVTAAGKTLRGWILTNNLPYMGTMASDPYKLLAYDGTTTQLKSLFGSDTYGGGWYNYIWDMDDFTSLTLANVRRWGVEAGHAASAKNVVNTWMDAIRYLDGYSMTGGTSGDKVRLSDIATYDKGTTTLRGYGVVTTLNGVYFCTGTVQFGTGATTHYFEMDGQILVFTEAMVKAGLYKLSTVGSGTNAIIKNSVLRSSGASDNTRFVLDFSDTSATVEFFGNLVVRGSTITFKSGMTATSNTFDNCGVITHAGASMNGCIVKNYEGTAGTSSLYYNVNADPDGEMDGMSFTKGTAATHAIRFGTSAPATMTLRDMTFSGYSSTTGNNDTALYFDDTGSDRTWTINAAGVSGLATTSYTKARAGDTVNIVADQRTITINARTSAGALITDSTDFTLVRESDLTVLLFDEDQTDGSTSYTYPYTSDVACYINVVSSGAYIPVTQENVTLGNADQTVNVILPADRAFSNP